MSAPIPVKVKPKVMTIKKLLSIDKDYLKHNLKKGGVLSFDDGVEIQYSKNEIIFLRHLLEPIVRLDLVKELNLNSALNIKKYFINNRYTGKTINSIVSALFEIIVRDFIRPRRGLDLIPQDYVFDTTLIDYTLDVVTINKKSTPSKEILVLFFKYCYEMNDDLWSNIVFENLEYTTGLDIRDFLDIQFEPELMDSIMEASEKQTADSIEYTYQVLDKIMKSDKFKDNPIAIGYNAGTMNPAQLRQMLASRGFITEITGQIFTVPFTYSFILGPRNIYEMAIESRSGAKALYFTIVGVEKSEYMARGIQLVSTILEKVIEGDCGSSEYLNWYLRPPEEHTGSDDLENMLGMYYLNEETNKLEVITKDSKHLYGKTIKLRHILKCKLKNSRHVCATCLGDISYSLFRHNNVGFFGTTVGTHKCTQFIISTKHLTMSAKPVSLTVAKEASKFIVTKGNNYYLRANINLNSGTHKIIIEQNEIIGLKGLNQLDITNSNPIRSSRLNSIFIEYVNKNGTEIAELKLRHKSTFGVFTKEFLSYMQNRWELDHLDRVIVDLADWDKTQPIVFSPEVEYSFLDLAIKVKSMFDKMEPDETPEGFLQKLFDVINSKLSVNLSLLSAMSYGFTVRNAASDDYRLGRHSNNVGIKSLDTIINNRSLGAGYGWENLNRNIFLPTSFYGKNNVALPMDIIMDLNNTIV